MDMATSTSICTCETSHSIPILESEIFDVLDELWDARLIELNSDFADVRDIGDFTEAHVSPELWDKWRFAAYHDTCPYGERHRRDSCTTDCGEGMD